MSLTARVRVRDAGSQLRDQPARLDEIANARREIGSTAELTKRDNQTLPVPVGVWPLEMICAASAESVCVFARTRHSRNAKRAAPILENL